MQKKKTYQQLSREERTIIADRLDHNASIKSIARELSRSPSTISREIKAHVTYKPKIGNNCVHKRDCLQSHLCKNCTSIYKKNCRKCLNCTSVCTFYEAIVCETLNSPPYVCNGCSKKAHCNLERKLYHAPKAQREYEENRRESRNGFDLTDEELKRIDSLVTPLIKKGQSPYHILQTHKEELAISESTLRRLIHSTCISTRNIDLRVQAKRKPRQKKDANEVIRIQKAKEGHLWNDFLAFIEQYPDTSIVEMDCVEGCKTDNAVFLTLYLNSCHVQLALVLNEHTSNDVVAALDKIEESIGKELFCSIFSVIKTDNGHEFSNVEGIERSLYGGKRTTVFYCEPNRSDEKGSCEKNHIHIRYVFPKGTSFETVTQAQLSLAMNHVNSYKRQSLGGKTPYEMAHFIGIPDDFFILLGLETIPADEVNLTPSLLN